MPVINLHSLPQFSDRMTWLYLEYGRIEKADDGLIFRDKTGETPIPIASLSTLMLGPGTVVTHRAAIAAAQMNCLLAWVGEGMVRTYASATGGASGRRAQDVCLALRRGFAGHADAAGSSRPRGSTGAGNLSAHRRGMRR